LLLILILMMKDFHKNHKIYFYSIFTRRYNAKIFELIDRDSEIFTLSHARNFYILITCHVYLSVIEKIFTYRYELSHESLSQPV